MAILYPITKNTLVRLQKFPDPEEERHRWLLKVAGGVKHLLPDDTCFRFLCELRDGCPKKDRDIPDKEIQRMVNDVYRSSKSSTVDAISHLPYSQRRSLNWPKPDHKFISKILKSVDPVFNAVTDLGVEAGYALSFLFESRDLICMGDHKKERYPYIMPLDQAIFYASSKQYIVPNPMKEDVLVGHGAETGRRLRENIKERRHLVYECDNENISKPQQAQIITALTELAPLVMVVDSGNKSLHAFYRVDHLSYKEQVNFFYIARLLGGDESSWSINAWLRMPGGVRNDEKIQNVRQKIVYLNGDKNE